MKEKEITKLDLLISFVNNIAELVCSPEEYLSPNCKDSCVLTVGYSLDDNNEPCIETLEEGDSVSDLKDTLSDLYSQVKAYLKADFSKKWEELQK